MTLSFSSFYTSVASPRHNELRLLLQFIKSRYILVGVEMLHETTDMQKGRSKGTASWPRTWVQGLTVQSILLFQISKKWLLCKIRQSLPFG